MATAQSLHSPPQRISSVVEEQSTSAVQCDAVTAHIEPGDCVLAEWRDERYHPATVLFVTSHGIDVKFT